MSHQYRYTLIDLIAMMDAHNAISCVRILSDHKERLAAAPGSRSSHHAWKGGYLDHVIDMMNMAVPMYAMLNSFRRLPFSLSDALLIIFLHDIEKPWRYMEPKDTNACGSKKDRMVFRKELLEEYGINLTAQQVNGLKYVEGEGNDYVAGQRVMNELAAFCHSCDVISARIWYNHPLPINESWGSRQNS